MFNKWWNQQPSLAFHNIGFTVSESVGSDQHARNLQVKHHFDSFNMIHLFNIDLVFLVNF